jgi:hypothetical protein
MLKRLRRDLSAFRFLAMDERNIEKPGVNKAKGGQIFVISEVIVF